MTSQLSGHAVTTHHPAEKLQQQDMAGKSEVECKSHQQELEDLQALLPDLDTKVVTTVQYILNVCV